MSLLSVTLAAGLGTIVLSQATVLDAIAAWAEDQKQVVVETAVVLDLGLDLGLAPHPCFGSLGEVVVDEYQTAGRADSDNEGAES